MTSEADSMLILPAKFIHATHVWFTFVIRLSAVLRGWLVRRCSGDIVLLQFGCRKVLIETVWLLPPIQHDSVGIQKKKKIINFMLYFTWGDTNKLKRFVGTEIIRKLTSCFYYLSNHGSHVF